MDENLETAGDSRGRDADALADEWGIVNPAVRALLDHIAEQLAAEFVRLMKESASAGLESTKDEEAKR